MGVRSPRVLPVAGLPKEALARLQVAQTALRQITTLGREPGWLPFWAAVQTIPESHLPGFLAGHRQHLVASSALLALPLDHFAAFDPPFNTALGFAALGAFLRFAKWEQMERIVGAMRADLRTVRREGNDVAIQVLRGEVRKQEERAAHPRIIESAATLIDGSRSQGSFAASCRAFVQLAARQSATPSWTPVFDHPEFIWIEGAEVEAEATTPTHGKWIVPLPDLETAVTVAGQLLPDFEAGRVRCAKFLVGTTELGGLYFLVYAEPKDHARRAILEHAAEQPAFFVYDADCYTAEAMGNRLQQLARSLRPEGVEAALDACASNMAAIDGPNFGVALGLNDVQKRIAQAVLKMHPDADPADRWNYLALTYFGNFRRVMEALLPNLLGIGK